MNEIRVTRHTINLMVLSLVLWFVGGAMAGDPTQKSHPTESPKEAGKEMPKEPAKPTQEQPGEYETTPGVTTVPAGTTSGTAASGTTSGTTSGTAASGTTSGTTSGTAASTTGGSTSVSSSSSGSGTTITMRLDRANPHWREVLQDYVVALKALLRLWSDYLTRPFNRERYMRDYRAYVQAYTDYQDAVRKYTTWQNQNQKKGAFDGRVVTYPTGATDPLAITSSTTSSDTALSTSLVGATPVAGATVEIWLNIVYIRDPGPGGYPRFRKQTGADGKFSFARLQDGNWNYTVTKSGFEVASGQFTVEAASVFRTIVLKKPQVQARAVRGNVYTIQSTFMSADLQAAVKSADVLDESLYRQIEDAVNSRPTGSPPLYIRAVAGQEVVLTRTDPVIAIYPPPPAEIHRMTTDTSGRFAFEDLKGQSYRLDIRRASFKPYSIGLDVHQLQGDLRVILIEDDADLGGTPLITE